MNKTELTMVVVLFAVLLAWGFFQRGTAPRPAPAPAAPAVEVSPEVVPAGESAAPAVRPGPPAAVGGGAAAERRGDEPVTDLSAGGGAEVERADPERTVVISNEVAAVTVSSWGGGITGVRLYRYPETQQAESEAVYLDFGARPALSISGMPGLSTAADFELTPDPDGGGVTVSRNLPDGLRFERGIRIEDAYRLLVTDTLRNEGAVAVATPGCGVTLGAMGMNAGESVTRGVAYLGIDTLASHGGRKVEYWGRKHLPALFGQRGGMMSCAQPNTSGMPAEVNHRIAQPLTWMAVKNKFFVQILATEGESADGEVGARRDTDVRGFTMAAVWGAMIFPERTLQPGETSTRTLSYFVGPKQYSLLKTLGNHQDEVMEFGWFSWMCKPLLLILNKINAVVRNYGIAIIFLTALVRIVFWPVTHKSTESMKKMQKLQPAIADIRAKYKSNPQKMNQEVMALYKENKVNPMAGCLPMLIQIPVFIALFTVLRSAVELRFAGFLWIRDLSEPENLLAGSIPLVGALNILPFFMTATMAWQQHLTPTAGDPQQQKMMMFMPVVMLFIFYSMPSALVLYWSTSQCLSIVQLLMQRRRSERSGETGVQPASAGGAAERRGKRRT